MIRVMDYSIRTWDKDKDGVLEQPQHVTYDTEVSGITSMVTSIYIAALLAASSMPKLLAIPYWQINMKAWLYQVQKT